MTSEQSKRRRVLRAAYEVAQIHGWALRDYRGMRLRDVLEEHSTAGAVVAWDSWTDSDLEQVI